MRKAFILTLLLASALVVSCSDSRVMTTSEIERLIDSNLKPGDSSEKIESFLKEQGWPFWYDDFVGRYQTGYPDGDVNEPHLIKGVAIWIYVDDSKAFVRAVVEEVYTG